MSAHLLCHRAIASAAGILLVAAAGAAAAQNVTGGQKAMSSAGEAGQRQTKEQGVEGIAPMARIDSRIRNRVQSRLSNRIDRNYDPQMTATTSVEAAGNQARAAGKPRGQ